MSKRFMCSLSIGLLLATGAAAQVAATAPTAAPTEAHAGFIKSVQGDVHVLGAGGASRVAQSGDRVLPIDRVTTGANGAASLVLRDGTMLVAGPNSQLDLKEFHFDATTQSGGMLVSLLRGSMRMVSGLIAKTQPDAVRIDTQTATIGIRGTDFIVMADPQ